MTSIPESVFGIVLLLNKDFEQACISASKHANTLEPSLVTLNTTDCFPHVTITHIDADTQSAMALWRDVPKEEIEVETRFTYASPFEGRVWAGLGVQPTQSLSALHYTVVDACESHQLRVRNEHRASYWPHLTLACWTKQPQRQLAIDQMPFGVSTAQLALVKMGDHGSVTEVLAKP